MGHFLRKCQVENVFDIFDPTNLSEKRNLTLLNRNTIIEFQSSFSKKKMSRDVNIWRKLSNETSSKEIYASDGTLDGISM